MAVDQFKLNYLTAATEPMAAVRRLAALTGAAQRRMARQIEAQYIVDHLVPLLNTQLAATTNPVTVAALQACIAGANGELTAAQADVVAANAAISGEQTNQTALSGQLATLQAGG